ncbi:Asp-tRNA(Asn)/Glu-tRNA(Gln) amidotransferase subunit GatA [Aminomonas paucivorans]|uniref:Asp-tRNA(Asn)/Glu-tRNA(Gln) amidotransferase subunit GatA n=1 Tax=Aminomonas paucivorans TaxID=81412 RepID=UPI0033340CE8
MDLHELSAWQVAQGLAAKRFSALEVTRACLDRIRSLDGRVKACLTVLEDRALEKAREVDGALARGEDPGLLSGVPVLVKDNLCTVGTRTTCGSRILGDWEPPYDATAVRLLKEAGAILLGKTNMDEFAMGSSTEHSAFGPTRNPWDPERVPGGSSGGSAAGVAAGFAPLALGSDTGGSIRQPAAFCGIQGLKPTYGLVSRYGLVAYASSLDQVGPLAREVGDLALGMDVIARPDPLDATSCREERPRFLDAVHTDNLKGLRIGVLGGFDDSAVEEPIRKALVLAARYCQDAGALLSEVRLPLSLEYGLASYYILAPAEASSNLARFDGVRYGSAEEASCLEDLYLRTRGADFGPEVKRRILTGTYALSSGYYDAFYLKAQKARRAIVREFRQVFGQVDAILTPTAPTRAFRQGEHLNDPIRMYLGDAFTLPANLAGLPALSLCAGIAEGLPTAVQVLGPWRKDQRLVRIGVMLERAFGAPSVAPLGKEESR